MIEPAKELESIYIFHEISFDFTVQKMKFSIKGFFSKCDQICSLLRTYQSLGPNLSWHADEYDSLKPFGFPFYEKTDKHSRRAISVIK